MIHVGGRWVDQGKHVRREHLRLMDRYLMGRRHSPSRHRQRSIKAPSTAEKEWADVRLLTCPLKEMGFTGRQMLKYRNGPTKTMCLPWCCEGERVIHAMNQGGWTSCVVYKKELDNMRAAGGVKGAAEGGDRK